MAAPFRVLWRYRTWRLAAVESRIASCGQSSRRSFQFSASQVYIPDFAFAFDIDGVLVRSSKAIPGARDALLYLQQERIPYILLTNGGGKSEEEKAADLENRLNVPIDANAIVQSHTPFGDLKQYHDKTVLIVGGDNDNCRLVAEKYGYKNAITPGDIFCSNPDIWPFARVFLDYYAKHSRPLPKPIDPTLGSDSLKIDAIFVYNDPRDWGLDSTVILDALLTDQGYLGTLSPKNGDTSLPNKGYQQGGQPPLYFSNPDLWWAASYPLNRLGQGGFLAAFEGLWAKVTGGVPLHKTISGKPHQITYEFAERRLRQLRKNLFRHVGLNDPLRRVYMVGDNPESDIRGANGYKSPHGSRWTSILVETGVFKPGTEPSCKPDILIPDVRQAVNWAVEHSKEQLGTIR